MRNARVIVVLVFSCLILSVLSAGCRCQSLHHEIKGDIRLKDKIYLTITMDYIVETSEALHEVTAKQDQLRFGLALALRDHPSTELDGRGKRNVINAVKSIARQVLTHPVKDIRITEYTFHER